MKYLTPAKINLYLEILGKRTDGYHRLQTVMQTVSLYDELEIELLPKNAEFVCTHRKLSKEKNNLVLKAVNLLQKFNKKKKGVSIILKKNIPLGGGLGGGSSDAGCVLRILNRIWKLNLSLRTLSSLAAKIGADVPFFLEGGYAYAEGIGEKIFPYPVTPEYWLVLVNPGLLIPSKNIYTQYDKLILERCRASGGPKRFDKLAVKTRNTKLFWQDLSTGREIANNLSNRLEDVVLPEFPEIAKIKEILISLGASGSLMSGSGSTVFGIVESEKKGKEILQKLKKYPWRTWLVRTVSPENYGQ